MKKLPAISSLKREIEKPKVAQSIAFLKTKQASLERFDDVEDLVLQINLEEPPPDLRGFEYHFRQVRSALAKALWSRGLFIGLSVLDDLLFSGFRSKPPADPVARALLIIKDNDVHKSGFVLYPLHSLGVNGVGFFEFFTGAKVQLAIASAGLVLRAQTNSLSGSIDFLNAARETFSISKRISCENIEHYYQSRSTKWLTRNPLLAVQVRMFSGAYYENQQFLIVKLKTATTLLFMMAALQLGYSSRKTDQWGSTRRVNNFQTLDIHHYFVFERPLKGGYLNTKCIPMNVRPDELSDLSAIPIDLAPKLWSRRLHVVSELAQCLSLVETRYMELIVLSKRKGGLAKAIGKTFTALSYFRRSFKSRGDASEQVLNLAIAFEVLLTAERAPKVSQRLERRIKLALKGINGSRRLQVATKDLYTARNQTVHNGMPSINYDILAGQESFVYVFLGVLRKIGRTPANASDPIGAILGD